MNSKIKKPKLVWLQAITCNGNTHSLLSANANRLKLFLDSFDLVYHPSLTTDILLDDLLKKEEDIDFLLVEGAITSNKEFFQISDQTTSEVLKSLF
ncbi:MAG: hypothetical protein ACNI3H_04790 [Halarcobacter ebronensis]